MKGPIVITKVGDRQIEIRRAIRQQGKFWMTADAVFELDGEYSYELIGQQCLFYNMFNAKPISLQGIEKIQQLYRERKAGTIVREIERINNALEMSADKKYTDPIHALSELYKGKIDEISQGDMKFLIDYKVFDKDDLKLLNIAKMNAKKKNFGLSSKVPTVLPILVMMGIVIPILFVMTQFNPLRWFN